MSDASASPPPTKAPEETAIDVLGAGNRYAKNAALFAALLYALGFVVVTVHLSRYGVFPHSIIRTQYLLAGFWAAVPIAACITSVNAIRVASTEHKFWSSNKPVGPVRAILRHMSHLAAAAYAAGIVLLIAAWMFSFLPTPAGTPVGAPQFTLWGIGKVILFAIGLSICAVTAIGGHGQKTQEEMDPLAATRGAERANMMVLLLLVAIGYLGFYAREIYTLIPAGWGGGKPLVVDLAVDDGQLPEWLFGHELDREERLRCTLVYEDEESLVVVPEDQHRVIQIPRRAVLARVSIGG